ncbi:MAG: hypothetical protein QG647_700 [Patescibacteria group bacterium]|nr:hypothetical protein [Patescibacteria group bacterium]
MEGNVEINSGVPTAQPEIAYIVSFKLPPPKEVPQVLNAQYREKIAQRFAELISNYANKVGLYSMSIKCNKNRKKNYTVHLTTNMPRHLVEVILALTETPPNPIYNKKSKNLKIGSNEA